MSGCQAGERQGRVRDRVTVIIWFDQTYTALGYPQNTNLVAPSWICRFTQKIIRKTPARRTAYYNPDPAWAVRWQGFMGNGYCFLG